MRGKKKIYPLVAEMPEARRIPLNWNALLRLSDLGGFLRKWAFKCALGPFTSADAIEYYDLRCIRDRPKSDRKSQRVGRFHGNYIINCSYS